MNHETDSSSLGFRSEARLILIHARKAWAMLPPRFKWAFGVASLMMALISICNTAFPLLLGRLVDELKHGADQNVATSDMYGVLWRFLGLIGTTFVVREVLQVIRSSVVENTCTRVEKAMTVHAISHLMKADLTSLSQEKIGALHGRLSRSVVGFVRFIRLAFLDFLPPLLTGILALVAVITKQPLLALVMAAVIPVSLFLTMRQLTSQKGVRLELIRSREEMDGTIVEQLGAMESVRAANAHEREVDRVARAAERRRRMESRHLLSMSLFSSAKALNEAFFHLSVLGMSAYLAINGTVSYGDILTFSFLFANVMTPLNAVHRSLDEGHECSLMVVDLLRILDEPFDRSFSPAEVKEPNLAIGQPLLVVKDLCVNYLTECGCKAALKNVSVTIHHGELVGLAGPSGCGKTTLVRVLLRLTHPTSGVVSVGNVPVECFSREAIGRLFGYVSQNPFIFSGTIEENIRYGKPDAATEAIEEAARLACIHDEITSMPGGYRAMVKERGANLSAGQRQRLALARVFLHDPPILILDEGTSALDTINERHVQQTIDLARGNRTVIIIAHRLSTMMDADRIYVLHDGGIVETGTYQELCHHGGVFADLVRSTEVGDLNLTRETVSA
jgi:ATP-binding cassette, subfamily B, bacterial